MTTVQYMPTLMSIVMIDNVPSEIRQTSSELCERYHHLDLISQQDRGAYH